MHKIFGAKAALLFALFGSSAMGETIIQDNIVFLNTAIDGSPLPYKGFDASIGQLNSVTFKASMDAEFSICCQFFGEAWFDVGVTFETDPNYANNPESFLNLNYIGAYYDRVTGSLIKTETIEDLREVSPGQYIWLGDDIISYYKFNLDFSEEFFGLSFFENNDIFNFNLYWEKKQYLLNPVIGSITDPVTFSLVYDYTPVMESGSAVIPIAPSLWLYGSALALVFSASRARLSGGRGARVPAGGLS